MAAATTLQPKTVGRTQEETAARAGTGAPSRPPGEADEGLHAEEAVRTGRGGSMRGGACGHGALGRGFLGGGEGEVDPSATAVLRAVRVSVTQEEHRQVLTLWDADDPAIPNFRDKTSETSVA